MARVEPQESRSERLLELISQLPENKQDEYVRMIEQTLFGAVMAESVRATG